MLELLLAISLIIPIFILVIFSTLLIFYTIMYDVNGSWRDVGKIVKIIFRDLSGLFILIRMRIRCLRAFTRNHGIQNIFLETVRKNSEKIAVHDISLGRSFTFAELNQLSCRYAHMMQEIDVTSRDVVALCMENGVHFVAAWIACAKIGAISAWVNTNLRRQSLVHTLQTARATVIIISSGCQQAVLDLLNEKLLKWDTIRVFVEGKSNHSFAISTDEVLTKMSSEEPVMKSEMTFYDPLCYIYTSGTTGLPKAAIIRHFRYFYIASGGECAFGIRSMSDRIYVCLPMYHTSAGVLGIGQMVLHGTTCIIRKKFSASSFWKDCVEFDCTVTQYIGEFLRYLLLIPTSKYEKVHRLRLLIGNGLRLSIWKQFQKRFNVGRIAEFYGSTEGTSNLVNIDGTEGACGFMTVMRCLAFIYPIKLFRVDESGKLKRDSRGYCIPIKPGEDGVLACTIHTNNPLYHFEGYLDKEETNKKIIKEPLPGSNPVFISGDIMYWDRYGYLYFKDRIGDTFRWKGENVSTNEVESIIFGMVEVKECAVYGVEVPGCEGRAGMAAIVPSDAYINPQIFLDSLYKNLTSTLPLYAVPIFIKIIPCIKKTGTFKIKKASFHKQGLTPTDLSAVFYLDLENKEYSELSKEIYKLIEQGNIKL